jgi:hypothetical protein
LSIDINSFLPLLLPTGRRVMRRDLVRIPRGFAHPDTMPLPIATTTAAELQGPGLPLGIHRDERYYGIGAAPRAAIGGGR